MKTRTNRKQHNKTRRGGGPKKTSQGLEKKSVPIEIWTQL